MLTACRSGVESIVSSASTPCIVEQISYALHAWVVSGRVIAFALCFFLGHVLTFMCLPEPSGAGAVVSSRLRVDPNFYIGVTPAEGRLSFGLGLVPSDTQD